MSLVAQMVLYNQSVIKLVQNHNRRLTVLGQVLGDASHEELGDSALQPHNLTSVVTLLQNNCALSHAHHLSYESYYS